MRGVWPLFIQSRSDATPEEHSKEVRETRTKKEELCLMWFRPEDFCWVTRGELATQKGMFGKIDDLGVTMRTALSSFLGSWFVKIFYSICFPYQFFVVAIYCFYFFMVTSLMYFRELNIQQQ